LALLGAHRILHVSVLRVRKVADNTCIFCVSYFQCWRWQLSHQLKYLQQYQSPSRLSMQFLLRQL